MSIVTDVPLLTYRRTRIVATVGPASRDPETLRRLVDAGVDVFRLNMSHGTHADHRVALTHVRAAAGDRPLTVFADLCGPKIRVEHFADGAIELTAGESVTVTTRKVLGVPGLIPTSYAGLASDVRPGARILLDDGKIELRVAAVTGPDVTCLVVAGGTLRDRKGMNLPDGAASAPALTEKDRADAHFALEAGVDLLALSFVRRASDIAELRALIRDAGHATPIIAKIEKPEALADIDAIIEAADAIMVARGDLGVELPPEVVPLAQQALVDLCRAAARPVIVATQMLESMIDCPRPTRAEVSDVAHAVRSGADAVMLSAETAAGNYPVEAVRMMDLVARQTEAYLWRSSEFGALTAGDSLACPTDADGATRPTDAAFARACAQLSRDLDVRSLVVVSQSGRSAAVVSGSRPAAPIVVASADVAVRRVANLRWGVISAALPAGAEDDLPAFAREIVQHLGLATPGQPVLLLRGFSADPALSAPTVTALSV